MKTKRVCRCVGKETEKRRGKMSVDVTLFKSLTFKSGNLNLGNRIKIMAINDKMTNQDPDPTNYDMHMHWNAYRNRNLAPRNDDFGRCALSMKSNERENEKCSLQTLLLVPSVGSSYRWPRLVGHFFYIQHSPLYMHRKRKQHF